MKNELTNYGMLKSRTATFVMFMLRYITPLLIFYIFLKNFL